jgi:hypothetical protein
MASNPQAFDVGFLETVVSKPQRENEGAKDTYISYLVTTKVTFFAYTFVVMAHHITDRLQIVYATRDKRAPALHRLRVPLSDVISRVPGCCSPTAT